MKRECREPTRPELCAWIFGHPVITWKEKAVAMYMLSLAAPVYGRFVAGVTLREVAEASRRDLGEIARNIRNLERFEILDIRFSKSQKIKTVYAFMKNLPAYPDTPPETRGRKQQKPRQSAT